TPQLELAFVGRERGELGGGLLLCLKRGARLRVAPLLLGADARRLPSGLVCESHSSSSACGRGPVLRNQRGPVMRPQQWIARAPVRSRRQWATISRQPTPAPASGACGTQAAA